MFRVVGCTANKGLALIVTPPQSDIDTPGAKFYRYSNKRIDNCPPYVFKEVTCHQALGIISTHNTKEDNNWVEFEYHEFKRLSYIANWLKNKESSLIP